MKRKMICASMFYMLGLFFASFFTGWLIIVAIIALMPILFSKSARKSFPFVAISFITGFIIFTLYSRNVYDKITAYDGKEVSFRGKIESIDIYENARAGFILDGKINSEQKADIIFYGEDYNCDIGDEIEFVGEVNAIENDYLFNGETHYKSQKIFLKAGSVKNVKLIKHNGLSIRCIFNSYRKRMISDFTTKLGAKEGGFLAGMIFGEKNNIEYNEKTLLYRSGIGHIMAVSGLHTALVAVIVVYLLKKLRLNRYIRFSILLVVMLAMMLLVNFSVSVIRAVVMILILYSSKLFLRESDTLNSLALAVLFISIENPFVIYSAGFWLSVCGTFGIGAVGPYFSSFTERKVLKSIIGTISASIAVMPPMLCFFGEISVVSVISNLLILPLCLLVIAVGVVYVISGGFISLLYPVKYIIRLIVCVSEYLGGLGFSYIPCDKKLMPVIIMILLYAFLVKTVTENKKLTAAVLAAGIAVFTVVSVLYSRNGYNEVKTAILGKNENAVVCITYGGNADVIDLSGNSKSPMYLEKYLSQCGIRKINSLYLTKNQSSQLSAYAINVTYDIDKIFLGEELTFSENWGTIKADRVYYDNQSFEYDCGKYSIIYKEGCLELKNNDINIAVAECGHAVDEDMDIAIYCGKFSEKDIFDVNGIYLDKTHKECINGINNFILTQKSGKFVIRRL